MSHTPEGEMIDILKRFCSKDPDRINIAEPWSVGEHSYATNGHFFIARVPRIEGVPDGEDSWMKAVPETLFSCADPTEWFPLAEIVLPKEEVADCSMCNGVGEYEHEDCDDCNGHHCEKCNGTGKTSIPTPVPVGNTHFQVAYLQILKTLPNCKIGPHKDPDNYAVFQFDGGDGRIMPIKPLGEWRQV